MTVGMVGIAAVVDLAVVVVAAVVVVEKLGADIGRDN